MAKEPNWTEEESKILKENYLKSKQELLRLLSHRKWGGILSMIFKLGLRGRPRCGKERGFNSKYKMNVNFFKTWTPESAYVFGRLMTDGSWRLRKTGGDMRIKSIDKENIEKIKFVMGSNHKIRKEKTPPGTYIYVFNIYNNELVRDLIKYETKFDDVVLKWDFFPDFLRGFIDGDGGIYIKKTSLEITITAKDKRVLELLNKRIGKTGSIYPHGSNCFTLRFNNTNSEKICNMIYEPKPFLYVSRKLSTWELWCAMKKQPITKMF